MTHEDEKYKGLGESRPNPSRRSRKKASGKKLPKLPKKQGSDIINFEDQGGNPGKDKKRQRKERGSHRRYRGS